ncbi:MAG: hypothetical protein WC812_03550 [Candidatus Pacearchaeota archaeon]|jgi:hypothetical protein
MTKDCLYGKAEACPYLEKCPYVSSQGLIPLNLSDKSREFLSWVCCLQEKSRVWQYENELRACLPKEDREKSFRTEIKNNLQSIEKLINNSE